MPNIVFTKGGYSFQFSKGRVYPVDDPKAVNVVVDYSEGVQLYAYDKGVVEQFFNLYFEQVDQADFENVEDWLVNVVVGPKNVFTYTDEDGVSHTVRMLDIKNQFKEVGAGLYSGVIHLRKEI